MIRTDLLRGKIAASGLSQTQMAKMLGITPNTFYRKMRKGIFNSNEMYKMIEILNIKEPEHIFFTRSGA